jgi:hypothetical protein
MAPGVHGVVSWILVVVGTLIGLEDRWVDVDRSVGEECEVECVAGTCVYDGSVVEDRLGVDDPVGQRGDAGLGQSTARSLEKGGGQVVDTGPRQLHAFQGAREGQGFGRPDPDQQALACVVRGEDNDVPALGRLLGGTDIADSHRQRELIGGGHFGRFLPSGGELAAQHGPGLVEPRLDRAD